MEMEMEIQHFLRERGKTYDRYSFVNLELDKAGSEKVTCLVCEKPVSGRCVKFSDEYYCHLSCIEVSSKMENLLLHVRSEHKDLIFTGELKNKGKEDAVCFGCEEPVVGPGYECSAPECKFLLHQSCAQLPLEMQHPFHPDHPLSLREPENKCYCKACSKNCNGCFYYRCNECYFQLDFLCATWPIPNRDDCHHEYRPIFMRSRFSCDACGKEAEGLASQCNICKLLIHCECSRFPLAIWITTHRHFLVITYSLREVREYKYKNIFCNICYEEINTEYGAYFCKRRDYVAHLECAYHFFKTVHEECDGSGSEDEGEIDAGFEEGAESIPHFGHDHTLSLSNEELTGDKRCDACVGLISAPFYRCRKCNNFFLHDRCASLSRKKKLTLHEHPLTLIPQVPIFGGLFRCSACFRFSQGFSYNCAECEFNLDVRCFSMPQTFEYKGHSHTLFLAVLPQEEKRCSACGHCRPNDKYKWLFVCTKCEFALCFKCVSIPCPGRYKFDAHPLEFTKFYEANDEDYYCLICEKKRPPEDWIYYCKECDFTAHIDCIFGRHPYIKFGNSFKWKNHEHLLTFVQKDELSPPCDDCGRAFHHIALECAECKFSKEATDLEGLNEDEYIILSDLNDEDLLKHCCQPVNLLTPRQSIHEGPSSKSRSIQNTFSLLLDNRSPKETSVVSRPSIFTRVMFY